MSGSSEKMTRRRFLGGLALAAGTTAVATCAPPGTGGGADKGAQGGGAPAAGTEGAAGGPAAKEAKEITFLNWDEVKDTPYETVIDQFRKETGKKVTVQPAPAEDYDTKMRTLLASGTPPDAMRINDDYVRGFSVSGYLQTLDSYIEQDKLNLDDYFEGVYKFARQPDGKYTAWSLGNQPRLIYYNADMFKEADAPLPPSKWTDENWRWDDFLDIAKKLTKPGKRWGALVYDDTGYEQTFSVNNGGTGIYSEDGKGFTLAEPKGAEAVQWATDLTCVHKVQPQSALLAQEGAADQMFVSGRLGMVFRTFGTTPYLRDNIKDFEWDVAPTPGKEKQMTEGSLIVFCIAKTATNPDGGWDLIKYLSGPEGGKTFAKSGTFVPVHKESATLIGTGEKKPGHIGLFTEAMSHLTTVNLTPNTLRARQIYRPQLDLVYSCKQKAKDVLTSVKADVEDALAQEF